MMQQRDRKKGFVYSFIIITLIVCAYFIPQSLRDDAGGIKSIDHPPTVSDITVTPMNGDGKTVGGTISLSVEVEDDKGVSKVEFYSSNGSYLIGTVQSEPFKVEWATDPWVPDGEQILKVIAYDSVNQKTEQYKTVQIKNTHHERSFRTIGYYAGWATYSGYQVSEIDGNKLTHLNYAFANISNNGKITVGDQWADIDQPFPGDSDTQPFKGNFSQLNELKNRYPHLKTLISVGGWTWSDHFSDVALTEESRAIFAESVVQFILKYGFDGVDLDWEYPVNGGEAGNVKRKSDKHNFTLLLKKIRERLDAQSAKDGKDYLLSIAVGPSSGHAANLELESISQYVDYIQLMTYDIHGEWDELTGLNAPLYTDPDSRFYQEWSVQDAVDTYLQKGVPANKIVMGIPLYGRVFHNVKGSSSGLYEPFYGGGSSIGYGEIEDEYLDKNGFTRHWEEDSKVPWLFNGSTFVTYDDAESIGYKTSFIKTKGLGGAMVWELSQDPNEVLLNKIYRDLNSRK